MGSLHLLVSDQVYVIVISCTSHLNDHCTVCESQLILTQSFFPSRQVSSLMKINSRRHVVGPQGLTGMDFEQMRPKNKNNAIYQAVG